MATSTRPAEPATSGARSRRNVLIVGIAVVVLVAVPLLIAAGASLWDHGKNSGTAPRWVTPAVIRATTGDGMAVKAQVSLDIGDADARDVVEQHMDQVGLLLQGTFATRTRQQLATDGGLAALTDDMRDRLNDYLQASGAEPVRSVVVGDIFYSRP